MKKLPALLTIALVLIPTTASAHHKRQDGAFLDVEWIGSCKKDVGAGYAEIGGLIDAQASDAEGLRRLHVVWRVFDTGEDEAGPRLIRIRRDSVPATTSGAAGLASTLDYTWHSHEGPVLEDRIAIATVVWDFGGFLIKHVRNLRNPVAYLIDTHDRIECWGLHEGRL